MTIENTILANTTAIENLTKALQEFMRGTIELNVKESEEVLPGLAPVAEIKESTELLGSASVDFATVRSLVLKLAPFFREEIKAINAKHGIAKLSSLLSDESDLKSAITDEAKLFAVFVDLSALERR